MWLYLRFFSLPCFFFNAGASDVEQTLMKNLFSNYMLKVRPAVSPEQRVVVRVGMILSSFVGLVRLQTPNNAWAESCAHHGCSTATYLCCKSSGLHTYVTLAASRILKIELLCVIIIMCSQIHVSKCGWKRLQPREQTEVVYYNFQPQIHLGSEHALLYYFLYVIFFQYNQPWTLTRHRPIALDWCKQISWLIFKSICPLWVTVETCWTFENPDEYW